MILLLLSQCRILMVKKKKGRWESADLSVSPISDLYSHLITLNFPQGES